MKKIAVKELAYFVCQSGNLTPEFFSNHDLEAGTRAHQYLQSKYNEESNAEVYIKSEISYLGEDYLLHGFIDGILNIDNEIIIEEIKSTTKDLDEITEDYHLEHLAQLKIYGYLYALLHEQRLVHLRLTYISIVDYETKSFDSILSIDELEEFTFSILEEYIHWLTMLDDAQKNKEITIQEIEFPFKEKRPGQRKFMAAIYKALNENDILYAIAPTGIGKTMAAIFSSLKALKKNDKLFYLTAKGTGKEAPIEAVKILANNGLKIKTIDLTAKSKICNHKLKNCNPDDCPYAVGFFDRLKAATMDIFDTTDIYDSKTITEYADKYKLCSFEFSLYLSYFCDIVIADYNYVFDPHAHLIRFFEDDSYNPKVLVDEAHNLISRSKEMYSAEISEDDIRVIRAKLNGIKPSVRGACNKILERIDSYREKLALETLYCDTFQDTELYALIKILTNKIDEIMSEDANRKIKGRDEIIEAYFKCLNFLRVSEVFSTMHRMLVKLVDDKVCINYYCLDASKFLLDSIRQSIHGIVFFSATLYPIDYHMNLLTQGEGNFIEIKSPFDPNNLDILINPNISTKYKQREASIDIIIEIIDAVVKAKPGNYITFFPSYQYLEMVSANLYDTDYEVIIQRAGMSDLERAEIIERFKSSTNTKLGMFIMGGVFSEGIDFIGDALTGVIIVGVGLPMICDENNILKDYFENIYKQGFEYAYIYPGFTKVIQAVGRVIRTDTDRGIAVLIDNRFIQANYQRLMPPHWQNKKIFNSSYALKKELQDFYNNKKGC